MLHGPAIEHGTTIVFYREIGDKAPQEDEERERRFVARASSVFNADQVGGWKPQVEVPASPVEVIAEVEAFVDGHVRLSSLALICGSADPVSLSGLAASEWTAATLDAVSDKMEIFYGSHALALAAGKGLITGERERHLHDAPVRACARWGSNVVHVSQQFYKQKTHPEVRIP